MIKKFVGALAVAAIAPVVLFAAPAHADYKGATCSYANSTIPKVSGSLLTSYIDPTYEIGATGTISDPTNRRWYWQILDGQTIIAQGNGYGNISKYTRMFNEPGTDYVKFKFHNQAETVNCLAMIPMAGGN